MLRRNVGGLNVYQTLHGVVNQKTIIRNSVPAHPVSNHSERSLQWRVIILNGTSWTLPSPFSVGNRSSALTGSCISHGTNLERLLVFHQPTWAFIVNYDFPESIGSLFHLHYRLVIFFCCFIKRCTEKQAFLLLRVDISTFWEKVGISICDSINIFAAASERGLWPPYSRGF